MPTTSETINYDTFFTATIKNYSRTLEKNFLEYRPLVKALFDNYSKSDTAGGRIWQGIAEYGQSPTVKMFNGPETFAQEPTQTMQPIQYQWRYLGGSMSMSQTEMLENSGPAALANITESRLNQVMRTMNLVLGNESFGDGTNYGGQTIVGLQAGIPTNDTTVVGGLDPAVWPFWRNNWVTNAGSFAANGVNGTTQDVVLTTFNNCTDGSLEHPTDIISDQSTWEAYNRTNVQQVRYVREGGDQSSGDMSIRGLEYQGIPWTWDRQCPAGTIYFINRAHLHFKVDPRFKFKWTDPLSYPNQLMYTRIVGLRLVLVYLSRMFLAVSTGWSA